MSDVKRPDIEDAIVQVCARAKLAGIDLSRSAALTMWRMEQDRKRFDQQLSNSP